MVRAIAWAQAQGYRSFARASSVSPSGRCAPCHL